MQRKVRYQTLWQHSIRKILLHVKIIRIIQEYINPNTAEFTEMMQNRSSRMRVTDISLNLPTGIILNDSIVKEFWDLIMALILIYIAAATPYVISFLDFDQQESFFYIDLVVDTMFILDLILTLNTAFYNEENILICTRADIFKNHLKHGLFIDLLSSIPLSYFGTSTKSYSSLIKFIRLRSLTRLLKLSKLFKVFSQDSSLFKQFERMIGISYSSERVLRVVLQVFICVHIAACIWHLLAKTDDYSPDTWIGKFGYQDNSNGEIYLKSIYYLLTTLATIGYGDIRPVSVLEKLFAIIWMIFALYFLSYSISSLTSLLNQIDVKKTLLGEYMNTIDDFSKEVKLSKRIKKEIQSTILQRIELMSTATQDKTLLIEEFPKDLRRQIAVSLQGGMAIRFELFFNADVHIITEVLPFMESIQAKPLQKVYSAGESASKIYFLVKGSVNFLLKNDKTTFLVFSDLKYFGDIETLLSLPRMNSAETTTECRFLVMGLKLLKKIQKYFPQFYLKMKESAFHRLKSTQKAKLEMKTLIHLNSIENFKRSSLISIRDIIKRRTGLMELKKKNVVAQAQQKHTVNKYLNKTNEYLIDCRVEIDNLKSLLDKVKCIYK